MKYSVVVVDDENLIARNIARSIEKLNPSFEVVGMFSNGKVALDYIRTHTIHLVVTDIRMPEMGGLELTRILKNEYPSITCVIVSGYNEFEYVKTALNYQAKDYLLKPINKEELEKCLEKIENRLRSVYNQLRRIEKENKTGLKPEEVAILVKEYINENYMHQICLTSIAENFCFSSAYLSKIFTKHMKITPSKYLKDVRIKQAQYLLTFPNVTIATISQQSGFLDQYHFSKTFKVSTGYSPSEYRNICTK